MNCPYCKKAYYQETSKYYTCHQCNVLRYEVRPGVIFIELYSKCKTFGAASYLYDAHVRFYNRIIYSSSSSFDWKFINSINMSHDSFIEQITPNNIDKWSEKIKKLQAFL